MIKICSWKMRKRRIQKQAEFPQNALTQKICVLQVGNLTHKIKLLLASSISSTPITIKTISKEADKTTISEI